MAVEGFALPIWILVVAKHDQKPLGKLLAVATFLLGDAAIIGAGHVLSWLVLPVVFVAGWAFTERAGVALGATWFTLWLHEGMWYLAVVYAVPYEIPGWPSAWTYLVPMATSFAVMAWLTRSRKIGLPFVTQSAFTSFWVAIGFPLGGVVWNLSAPLRLGDWMEIASWWCAGLSVVAFLAWSRRPR